jgi:transposase
MMGQRQEITPKLFYTHIDLAERIPEDHRLRRVLATLDMEFVRKEVADCYGCNGQESIDPIMLMKMMLLLFMEQVPSERELVRQMRYRLDWMWFCGLDFDDTIPNHSVLSKARALWGPDVFTSLFARVLEQCIHAGLVSGEVLHVDASCIAGNVDADKLQPVLRLVAQKLYEHLEESSKVEPAGPSGRLTGQSDPEAGVTRSYGQTVCGYKDHRAVDDAHGIVTATLTTDAAVDEGQMLGQVLAAHEVNTQEAPQTVVTDKKYGTAQNYRMLREQGMTPCIPHKHPSAPRGKFAHDQFTYDAGGDCFMCPAGQTMRPYRRDLVDRRVRYRAARGVCLACPLRKQCTTSKYGRRVERHMDQEHIDWADACLSRGRRRRLMGRRKSCVEGSFADAANCHHFKRARWRGLVRMRIQNLLVATCQNLRKLLRKKRRKSPALAQAFDASCPTVARTAPTGVVLTSIGSAIAKIGATITRLSKSVWKSDRSIFTPDNALTSS